jgi:hypothetical protein
MIDEEEPDALMMELGDRLAVDGRDHVAVRESSDARRTAR